MGEKILIHVNRRITQIRDKINHTKDKNCLSTNYVPSFGHDLSMNIKAQTIDCGEFNQQDLPQVFVLPSFLLYLFSKLRTISSVTVSNTLGLEVLLT